jgi:hypothetical protein
MSSEWVSLLSFYAVLELYRLSCRGLDEDIHTPDSSGSFESKKFICWDDS